VPNRRPQLRLVSSASPEEAAAVVAAVERFLRDVAPPHEEPADRGRGWARAARLEAVGFGGTDAVSPWGDPHPWA